MAVAGEGLQTLAGLAVVTFIGVPAGTSSFEVGIFDGDTSADWDSRSSAPILVYKLYRDALKTGSTASLLAQWTSEDAVNDGWYTRTFATDGAARAPSGNYFYRLEVNWDDPSNSSSFNNFKIRTTGQVSLRAGQEFGFAGGPQNIGGPNPDPCVGSGDPNPGDTNDADANTYDGDWLWYFYVPTVQSAIAFRDGDSDRANDENSPGQPADDGTPYGACAEVHPSILYDVTEPPDAAGVVHVYTNNNPSGNVEWEDFTIGPNPGDDYVINYPLQPGLWKLRVQGMDAHNFNVLRASREVYSTPDPPLTVNPVPELEPDREQTTKDGVTVEYGHNATNRGTTDSFDLRAASGHGWATRIYHDSNGNGKRDAGEPQVNMTPSLGTNQSYPIVVQVDVPGGTGNTDDVATVRASSRTEWAVQDDALDTTHVRVNTPPVADAGGPYLGFEGLPINFDASGSFDPEATPLTYRWDWDGDGTFDETTTQPGVPHTFGDDLTNHIVVLQVSDGTLTDDATAIVTVLNIAPAVSMEIVPTGDEADGLTFRARTTDPGSDDLTVTWWGHCNGWTPATILYNEPSIGPDPDPSPDIHPRDETVEQTVVCGDDGTFDFNLRVEDDDGGVTTVSGTFDVFNLPPTLAVPPPDLVPVDEGTAVTVSATATDPGSDDLTFTWTWQFGPTESHAYFNDGVGPDPDHSPDGTFPFAATDGSSFTYGDDGTYLVTLVVHDDDGASITYTTMVQVRNVAPTVDAGLDGGTIEATAVSFTFTFSDPGFDQPAAGTVEDFTATVDWGYGPSESFPVVEVPGGPGVPTVGTIQASHVYGDNGAFVVTVTVCDDDGGCGSDTMVVSVANVDPVIDDVQAYVVADLRVRVAGEKWHDVRMDLVWNDQVTGSARVVRYPGSPDDQSATVEGGRIQLLGAFRITLYYTPDDDPVNGQPNGANPVWVIITLPSGQEVWLHHTFNVRHPATWVWTLDDVRPYLVGEEITFEASASDVGSDDLTFAWSFGDGARASATYFNDGVAPDPFPSPEVNPIGATDVTGHVFGGAGTSTVMLTVTDDDGGTVTRIFTISVG